ncbi:hypothetical protein [Sphingobacterium sp. UBA1498]|uniref:hypothetical protein n=1 Tax=Sphingobacterium sp. UBA1498 TaxID=1947481 RepID=UPI0025F2E1F0|nr:hypothetical protein [Sphingobacterium sp. UBA1498]
MNITPNISHYRSLDRYLNGDNKEDLLGFYSTAKPINIVEEIKKSKITLVIGEPGYGKSKYLAELIKSHQDIYGELLDCKDYPGLIFNKFLNDPSDKSPSTTKFLYLDSLDEVDLTMIKSILKKVEIIISNNVNIIIACRNHYIFDLKPQLLQLPIENIIQIQEFNHSQIIEYIDGEFENQKISQYFIELLNSSSFNVLKTPRYLKAFIDTYKDDIESEKIDLNFSRIDLFEKVIYHKLVSEWNKLRGKKNVNINEITLSKRILEKIALVFEIYQKNQITIDELVSFFDEIHSNISTIFLNSCNLDHFIERTLKKTGNVISFDNTEFTEYLAAKELLRIGNTSQIIFDLILNKDLNIIYPNWYNVLAFAIEINPQETLSILSNYIENVNITNIDEKLIHTLLHVNLGNFDSSTIPNIFSTVFNYYQYSKYSIGNYCDLIAGFYTDESQELIKVDNTDTNYRNPQQLNKGLIIKNLAPKDRLPLQLKYDWIQYIKKININSITQSNGLSNYLWILESLISPEEFRSHAIIKNIQNKESAEIIIESYIRYESGVFVDDFLGLIIKYPDINNKDRYLSSLKDVDSIIKISDHLLKDTQNRNTFFSNEYSYVDFSPIFKIISDNKTILKDKIKHILFSYIEDDEHPYFDGSKQLFLGECIKFLIRNDSLAELIQHSTFDRTILYEFHNGIAESIDINEYNQIVNLFNSSSIPPFELQRLNVYIKLNNPNLAKELAKEHEHFQEKNLEEKELVAKQKEDDEKALVDNFNTRIINATSVTDVIFDEFLKRKDLYKEKLDGNSIEKLKLEVSNIITSIDPKSFRIFITERSPTYSSLDVRNDRFFRLFYYLKIAKELQLIDLMKDNRVKIIKYIPLLSDSDQTKLVFDILGHVSFEEQEELYNFCINRTDDLSLAEPFNFISIISNNNWIIFKPYLKNILDNKTMREDVKIQVLKAFGELSSTFLDKQFLQNLEHANYKKNYIGNIANQYLISFFLDSDSIDKRFEYFINNIKQKTFKQDQLSDYWYGQTPYFSCLHKISDDKIGGKILILLEESLKLNLTPDNSERRSILQNEVLKYYELNISLRNLFEIERVLNNSLYISTKHTFHENLKTLKFILLNKNVSYRSISESIQSYNEVRKRKYLAIYDVSDLKSKIEESILDFKSFFFEEAYSHVITKMASKGNIQGPVFSEDTLQKTLKIALENALLNKGIRNVDIMRELQIFDNKRLDFVVKYGFIGPIIFELKLLNNPEIQKQEKRKEYKKKLLQYINSVKSKFSYYIVFNVDLNTPQSNFSEFQNLVQEYSDIPNLKIELIDCI